LRQACNWRRANINEEVKEEEEGKALEAKRSVE
jgi:hypothetical protein